MQKMNEGRLRLLTNMKQKPQQKLPNLIERMNLFAVNFT